MTEIQTRAARPTHATPLPPKALGIAIATLEAMAGRRPLHQIRARMTRPAFETLVRLLETGAFSKSRVGRISAQMPSHSAVEASVRIELGGRWLAGIIRLDVGPDGWRCSDFGVLGFSH